MYIREITERLAILKREINDVSRMNVRYWGRSEHSPLDKAAYQTRQLRLTQIKDELVYMTKHAA
jgi:hypothetical protein